ncbi:undecaprenyl diphosphate synthase family protein [Candidatus Peribacteria bacterium]|nr:MAG: undecaprenyl diphosphate synthase family protein [Candidatus Peribacteria bacterium]
MSASPETGLWIEHTCDGNRRAGVRKLAQQGIIVNPADLDEDQAFECNNDGGEATKRIIEAARDEMVGLISLWAWSVNNWKRPPGQQKAVFRVVEAFLQDLEANWIHLPENQDVRLVHMGRKERLTQQAPSMMDVMQRVMDITQDRKGMVVSLMMDYSGPDEEDRARELWKADTSRPFTDFLDLPQQGIAWRELDLRIRTGDGDTDLKHINSVMSGYTRDKTRDVFPDCLLEDFTPELFRTYLAELRNMKQKEGR